MDNKLESMKKKRSWPNLKYYPGTCRGGGNPRRTVKMVNVSAEIVSGHFPNTSHRVAPGVKHHIVKTYRQSSMYS
jgi:hypothetical protein